MTDLKSLSADQLAEKVRPYVGRDAPLYTNDEPFLALSELARRASERDQAVQHASDMEKAAAGMSANLTALGSELTERIDELEAERDQAVRERDEARAFLRTATMMREAETRRLRDALEKIRDAEYPAMATAARIARSALAAGGGKAARVSPGKENE